MHDRIDSRLTATRADYDQETLAAEGEAISHYRANGPEVKPDFHEVLFWARLAASQARKNPFRTQEEATILRSISEREDVLAEFFRWRESPYFTAREKAAIELGESISRKSAKKSNDAILRKERRYFNTSELVHLSLTIRAITDWLDQNSRMRAHVLIVQAETAEQNLLRKQISESGVECGAVFVQEPHEALALLRGEERQWFRSQLIALVVGVRLSQISGAEVLKEVRSIPGLEKLPVVVMSSSVEPQDLEECMRLAQESTRECAVNAGSLAETIALIFNRAQEAKEQVSKTTKSEAGEASLNVVYKRLREHFEQKGLKRKVPTAS